MTTAELLKIITEVRHESTELGCNTAITEALARLSARRRAAIRDLDNADDLVDLAKKEGYASGLSDAYEAIMSIRVPVNE